MWIVKASLKNPYAVGVLALMILVIGMVALTNVPVDILPVFKAPAVQVMTYFGGMPTASIEKTITNRIERWTDQATGVKRVESKSTLGVSIVRLYFRDDIDPNGALTQTNSLALSTLPTLPPNTLPPVVLPFDPTGTMPLGMLTLTSPDLNETHLKDIGRIDVRNMLGGVPGVVAPAVFGGKDRTVLIYVDPQKLQARNLSPLDVVKALQRQNLMISPGVAKFGHYEFELDSNAMVDAVRQLNNIPIRTDPGNRVYLRDVGHAEDSHAIQTGLVRINGRREVYVPIYRQQGASTLTVVDGVRKDIPHMEAVLKSEGYHVKLDFVMDQSIYVREAIHALIHEGVIGALLVAAMILIFLGNGRMTLIATLSIPLAVLCSIIGLYATGNTINAMTLGGLALAIGPLVDDAIVVLENTHRHREMGKSRITAAFDGAVEVTVPVLVATATTIIVLCPIALMPGMGGFLFRPLTLAVAFAMAASFILSRTLVPMLCAKILPDKHSAACGGTGLEDEAQADYAASDRKDGSAVGTHPGEDAPGVEDRPSQDGFFRRTHLRIEAFLERLTRGYERALDRALRHRALVLSAVGLLFVGSLGLLPFIGREFFPQVDAGQITMFVRCPAGTNIEATEKRIEQVEHFIKQTIPAHDRKMIISEIGLVPDWSAAYTHNDGTEDTTIKIQLRKDRRQSSQEYAIELRHRFISDPRFAGMHASFDTGGMVSAALNYGASSPIDVRIEGGTLNQAMAVARQVRDRVAGIPGAADVHILQRLDAPERLIEVDRQKAADVGLSMYDVMSQVETALNSSVGLKRNFWIDSKTGNQYFVAVQYREDPKMKLEDLLDVPATGTKAAHPVQLSTLVHIKYADAPVEVTHVNLARTFDVLINTEHRDIGSIASDVRHSLKGLQLPAGMRISLQGEYARMNQSFGSLGFGLAMAAVLVYLLLVALFRSFLGPFIIMLAVPLGLIGVLTMLFLTGTTLNVQSSMGVIFMVGIVVSNGVLLVDFANKQRKQGQSVRQAITTAAAIRFRPILMTFLATFLDLLPMAIGLGRGSEANVPLARAVVGGLLTSTCLTLFVVPIMYTLLNKERTKPEPDVDAHLARSDFAPNAGLRNNTRAAEPVSLEG